MLEMEERQTEVGEVTPVGATNENPTPNLKEPLTSGETTDEQTNNASQNEPASPQSAFDAYESKKSERLEKVNDFISQSQDGSKLLLNHQLQMSILEIVDAKDSALKFPSSHIIQKENMEKIEELKTSLLEEIATFANKLAEKSGFVVTDFSYGASQVSSPVPMLQEANADSSN